MNFKNFFSRKTHFCILGDRFYSDIECNTKDIKELKLKSENQEKVVKENSDTLKHITKDSIGKIKDVSSNCLQIEKNIRYIYNIVYVNNVRCFPAKCPSRTDIPPLIWNKKFNVKSSFVDKQSMIRYHT